ncbi:cAMP phosphodiesterase, partial [Leuconostoc pseudomesenteroides]
EYLGISYRHLLYTYNQLVDEGFIDKIGRNKYRLNMQRIESLSITATTSDHAELQ